MKAKQYSIYATKEKLFNLAYTRCSYPNCQVIGQHNLELAHGIAQGTANEDMVINLWRELFKENITRTYAREKIINNPDNLHVSCRKHNAYFNYANNRELVKSYLLIKWLEQNGFDKKKVEELKKEFKDKRLQHIRKGKK